MLLISGVSLRAVVALSLTIAFFPIIFTPRRSTLFPYTTLFRSCRHAPFLLHRSGLRRLALGGHRHGPAGVGPERKSTRLNSSHANSSYAGLCLKKKRRRRYERRARRVRSWSAAPAPPRCRPRQP